VQHSYIELDTAIGFLLVYLFAVWLTVFEHKINITESYQRNTIKSFWSIIKFAHFVQLSKFLKNKMRVNTKAISLVANKARKKKKYQQPRKTLKITNSSESHCHLSSHSKYENCIRTFSIFFSMVFGK